MTGMVIRGSRNIFTIRMDGEAAHEARYLECRIKGKILKGVDAYYNPLAPGDRVTVEVSAPADAGTDAGAGAAQGKITGLMERRTVFTRKNQKALGAHRSAAAQILAANADLVLVVTTPVSPPFRPRFLDRALIQADAAGMDAAIVCNKQDLCDAAGEDLLDVEERLEDFSRIGYKVIRVSAKTGEGMAELGRLIRGRFSVLVGQSGVGKSSVVNALLPAAQARVGALNEKYDRGNHTTTQGEIIEIPEFPGTFIIDTPGIRLFTTEGVRGEDLILYMREFAPLAGQCSYGHSCTHRTEPGCKIMEAVSAGVIHEDRYDSFIRMMEELALSAKLAGEKR